MLLTFVILAAYCAGRWLVWRVNYMALLYWVVSEDLEPPTEGEMAACVKKVVRRIMGLK